MRDSFEITIKNLQNDGLNAREIKTRKEDLLCFSTDLSSKFRKLYKPTFFYFINYSFAQYYKNRISGGHQMIKYFDQLSGYNYSAITPIILANDIEIADILPLFGGEDINEIGQYVFFELKKLEGTSKGFTWEGFRKYLLNYNSRKIIKQLNPYATDFVATKLMFYGREDTVKEIIESSHNILLVGARRIGKSSVAYNIQEKMGYLPVVEDLVDKNKYRKCAYVDLSSLSPGFTTDIWEKILINFEFDSRIFMPFSRKKRGTEIINRFQDGVAEILRRTNGKLIIILDEVDDWLLKDYENNWLNTNALRAITDRGDVKIILVGYEKLNQASLSDTFPFNERYKLIKLRPVIRDTAEKLIVEPIKELDINIPEELKQDLVERIWRISAGRPHLIQSVCRELVNQIAEDEQSNTIDQMHFEAALISSNIKMTIENIPQSGTFLAKLICIVSSVSMSTEHKKPNTFLIEELLSQMEEFGYKFDADQFDLAMKELDLRDIITSIKNSESRYKWTNRIFIKAFQKYVKKIGFERLTKDLVRKVNETEKKIYFRK